MQGLESISEDIKKFELLLDMQKMLFQFQDDSDNNVDNKLGIFLALTIAIILGIFTIDHKPISGIKNVELVIGLSCLFFSSYFLALGMYAKKYSDPFDGKAEHSSSDSYQKILLQILSDCKKATQDNEVNLKKKVNSFKKGFIFLIVGSLLVILAFMNTVIIYI